VACFLTLLISWSFLSSVSTVYPIADIKLDEAARLSVRSQSLVNKAVNHHHIIIIVVTRHIVEVLDLDIVEGRRDDVLIRILQPVLLLHHSVKVFKLIICFLGVKSFFIVRQGLFSVVPLL